MKKNRQMDTRQKVIITLRTIRFIAAIAMVSAVVAGALGYGDAVKLVSAAGGAGAAIVFKAVAAHTFA